MRNIKKQLNFGKIDFYNKRVKENEVSVEIEYKENKKGQKIFTAAGGIWNRYGTDTIISGQCLYTIFKYIHDPTFIEIVRLWELYHLNDRYPECEHQHDLKWNEKAKEKIKLYNWVMIHDVAMLSKKTKKSAFEALKKGEIFQSTNKEIFIADLKYEIKTNTEKLPEKLSAFYEKRKHRHVEEKYKDSIKESEHPEGILLKPCPVCGYKYGSAWNYFPIPEKDEKIILYLLEHGNIEGIKEA